MNSVLALLAKLVQSDWGSVTCTMLLLTICLEIRQDIHERKARKSTFPETRLEAEARIRMGDVVFVQLLRWCIHCRQQESTVHASSSNEASCELVEGLKQIFVRYHLGEV